MFTSCDTDIQKVVIKATTYSNPYSNATNNDLFKLELSYSFKNNSTNNDHKVDGFLTIGSKAFMVRC
jgi:hypothetical protein